jgi:hypothetical protein
MGHESWLAAAYKEGIHKVVAACSTDGSRGEGGDEGRVDRLLAGERVGEGGGCNRGKQGWCAGYLPQGLIT